MCPGRRSTSTTTSPGCCGGAPAWLYSHLHAGHEQVAYVEGLDAALSAHLLDIMLAFPDLTIVVLADHGRVDVSCDQAAPFLHFLVPKSRSEAVTNLRAHADDVVSAFDLHATVVGWAHRSQATTAPARLRSLPVCGLNTAQLRREQVQELIASPTTGFTRPFRIPLSDRFAPADLTAPRGRGAARGCRAAGVAPFSCHAKRIQPEDPVFCCSWASLSNVTRGQLSREHQELARRKVGDAYDGSDIHESVCRFTLGMAVWRALDWLNDLGAAKGDCEWLSLHKLERVLGVGGVFHIRFSVQQGVPRRVFDVVVDAEKFVGAEADSARVENSPVIFHKISQVTRYAKYEWCTPPAARAEACVCGHGDTGSSSGAK
mmetsp:Transcript_93146/g.249451  ORF Transcript_93146/g.249451 Transcript_93146/m.249451 type:complete len:374 (+) Transcript_93146:631-1752(+)